MALSFTDQHNRRLLALLLEHYLSRDLKIPQRLSRLESRIDALLDQRDDYVYQLLVDYSRAVDSRCDGDKSKLMRRIDRLLPRSAGVRNPADMRAAQRRNR